MAEVIYDGMDNIESHFPDDSSYDERNLEVSDIGNGVHSGSENKNIHILCERVLQLALSGGSCMWWLSVCMCVCLCVCVCLCAYVHVHVCVLCVCVCGLVWLHSQLPSFCTPI